MRFSLARPPLPRAMLLRLESGRLVLLSVLLGVLVGGLCLLLRFVLDLLRPLGAWLTHYAPPGTLGEGGLLMAFGEAWPWLLLILPLAGAAYTWLVPAEPGGSLTQLVRGSHVAGRDPWPSLATQARTLLGTLLAYLSGLLVGRDSLFIALGQMGTRLLGRLTKLDPAELRTLMIAGAAAGLGAVLHAPLAAAVLVAEVLYRRFEFEFEVLLPSILAAVAAYALYGLGYGFAPLLSADFVQVPALGQWPAFGLLMLLVTGAGWLLLLACRLLPSTLTDGKWRPLLGALFGLVTAALAFWVSPRVLGDGSGWVQVGLSGFLGTEAGAQGLWRWLLLALGARLAFGGGVLPSVGIGGMLGLGLAPLLGLDAALAGLVGATAFMTVTLNVPVGATLLAVAWGGDTALPLALAAAGIAHALSGEPGIVPGQMRSRAAGALARAQTMPQLPDTVRNLPRHVPEVPGVPYEVNAAAEAPERELYRRAVPRSWQGAQLRDVVLPPGIEVVGVMRSGELRLSRPELRLTPDDELIFLARADAYAALEAVLRLPGA